MTPSSEPGNLLVVFTGSTGCSAYHIDSNPKSSAFEAIKEAFTLYAGSGVEIPIVIKISLPWNNLISVTDHIKLPKLVKCTLD